MNMRVFSPCTLEEASKYLKQPQAKVLAGGTDIIIELKKGEIQIKSLVDIGYIEELKRINIGNSRIRLGSAVTFSDIINNQELKKIIPSLWESAYSMGACQIQNRATIGGNICNAAPAADSIPVFLSLNAECIIFGGEGRRKISLDDFIKGNKKIDLNQGELLECIEFENPKNNEYFGFSKLGKRNALAISTIACAIKITLSNDTIIGASICTGSLGIKAIREKETEKYLLNKKINTIKIEQTAETLSKEVQERLKGRASIVYKKVAVKGVLKEALIKCLDKVKDVKSNG